MEFPPRLETLLRDESEDDAAFRDRVAARIAERGTDGWQLQTRQDHDASVNLVFTHPPVD